MRKTKACKAVDARKEPTIWSAEAFGEGGYEIVPPGKEEAFRKLAEEENRRRRPGMYAEDDAATVRMRRSTAARMENRNDVE